MHNELHPAVDDYLETIGWLTEEGSPVISARIARRLGKSKASVSEMLERLAASGYVERSGRNIVLTQQGRASALGVIRRHRLAERLLVDVVGLRWSGVHLEAGRFAGVISDDVADRLVELLKDPATCPHGNPIPGSASPPPTPGTQVALAGVGPGQVVQLARIAQQIEMDVASLEYLDDGGFVPGVVASVLERGPDGTLVVGADGTALALGPKLCERLFVVVAG